MWNIVSKFSSYEIFKILTIKQNHYSDPSKNNDHGKKRCNTHKDAYVYNVVVEIGGGTQRIWQQQYHRVEHS